MKLLTIFSFFRDYLSFFQDFFGPTWGWVLTIISILFLIFLVICGFGLAFEADNEMDWKQKRNLHIK